MIGGVLGAATQPANGHNDIQTSKDKIMEPDLGLYLPEKGADFLVPSPALLSCAPAPLAGLAPLRCLLVMILGKVWPD